MTQKKKKEARIKPIRGQCPTNLEDRLNYVSYLYDFLKHGREKPQEWDGRRYGALVTWAKLFADVHGWIPKTPINLTQVVSQTVDMKTEQERQQHSREILSKMDEKGRDAVYEYITAMSEQK